ncbi:radical SAM/SPASM domain-containing protein [Thermoactinomyces mirandus]|uniref:radical SAM/SPASM domain-containing protein n=1 Tax=Thermoactinomyces mirandus TaxID=2756294 RepID=UPI0028AA942C|nr:radical SAM protein [Thermoactinomyces mirandus]
MEFSLSSKIEFFPLEEVEKYSPKMFFINSMTGGLIVIDKDSIAYRLLSRLRTMEGKKSIEEIIALNPQFDRTFIIDFIYTLVKRGIVSIDQYLNSTVSSEHNYERFLRPTARHINLCIFHIHNYCNLACAYCYLAEPGTRKKIRLETMLEAAEKIYDSGSKSITFEFHGGEPTMSMEVIQQFVDRVKEEFKTKFHHIGFSIQTNAYRLTDKHIDFLTQNKFKIRVSIDGTKEVHDSYRVTHSGKGTFDIILNNIAKMIKKGLKVEACAVVHSKNLDCLEEMYHVLSKTGVQGIRFLPIFKVSELNSDYYLDGKKYFSKFFGLIKELYSKDKDSLGIFSNLVIGEINAIQSFDRTYMCLKSSCGAGNEMIALDVDGEVYPCEEMIGMPEFLLGNVFDISFRNMKQHPIVAEIHNRKTNQIEQCKVCEWKEMCHAGCPKKSYNVFGNLHSPSEMCSYYKNMFPALVDLLYNHREENGLYVIKK